jgi:hypothetical protein
MRVIEGRGYLTRFNSDSPFAGWITARQLDAKVPIQAAPWLALQTLSELARLLPGGLALLWDLPQPSLSGLPHEVRAAFWSALGHLPGLTLHVRDEAFADHLEGPIHGWFHDAQAPKGSMGQAWRQGWIGWVPEPDAAWSLPGLGRAEGAPEFPEETLPGCHWGEVILPLGALKDVTAGDLLSLLGDIQAGIERNLSLRMSAHAWPEVFPFNRRRTGWRVAVLGGREFVAANGSWESMAERLRGFVTELSESLKCPIQLGSSHDPDAASLLGHQAMREGHPWRYSLPIPPASPTFTPGLGADPREAAPLEFRVAYPDSLASLLSHPPIAFLRTPNLPQESAVAAFLRGLNRIPAIRWIPPEMPPPGPFSQERPWAPASAFAPLPDVTQALQPRLFEELDSAEGDPV